MAAAGIKIIKALCSALIFVGMVILYLFNCIPYLFLFLIAGAFLIIIGTIWHVLFSHMLGFWPAIIADIVLIGLLFANWCKENENSRYDLELRAKERRGEPLESWEHETIHPKSSPGLSFTDLALGFILWKVFFGNNSDKK